MKKLFRSVLCAALLTMAVCIPSFAAEREVPAQQGDFYVLVNGEYVTFTDAVPQIQSDRSCLPFVAVFEQLGFAEEDMTWNGETSTVTATKDDLTISLTIGQKQITLIEGEKTNVIDTDVAPYINPALSRTYVPFGLVADALGYRVGWDAQQRTVIIDDVAAILAANEETYTLMDKYMAYNKEFTAKNQSVSGKYAMDYTVDAAVAEEATAIDVSANGTYKMITAGSTALEFDTDMTIDVNIDGADAAEAEAMLAIFPLDVDFAMRGDMADGVLYFQSNAMATLAGQPEMANAWFKLDMAAIMAQSQEMIGMDYATLMQMSMDSMDKSFAESLPEILASMPLISAEMTTTDFLAQLNAILADSAFKQSGSTYTSTVTQDGATISFALYTSGNKVTGYAMNLAAADPSFGEIELVATMKQDKMDLTMKMDFEVAVDESSSVSMTMDMAMDGTYKTTSTAPATQPPAGATVIDLFQLLLGA